MRKQCIFCQRNDQKITKEHIFPNWLAALFEPNAACVNEATNADGSVAYRYTSKIFQATTNDVCASCNHGWMSELENSARPILTRMFKQKNIVLDKKKQQILADWAVKTILVLNHNNPPNPQKSFIPLEHYEEFYSNRNKVNYTLVLLGYIPGKHFGNGDLIAASRISIAENIRVPVELSQELKAKHNVGKNIYGATLKIANVVFQVIGQDFADGSTYKVEVFLPDEPLRTIRPYAKKIRWPLARSVEEIGGIEVLNEAIKGSK